jgi:hypothetical protein
MKRSILVLAALLTPSVSVAAPACGQRAAVLAQLANQFSEAPAGVGLASNGGLLELLTSGRGETWTLIVTMPNGMTCLLAAGESWQPRETVALVEPQI